jgi:uncharacterized protein YjiS (DUF1127 family)
MAFLQINTLANNTLFFKIKRVFNVFLNNYNNWILYKTTVSELQALSARELADLGINRSMINTVAREAVYRSI